MNEKLTKDQMASLVDFGNNGIKHLKTAEELIAML